MIQRLRQLMLPTELAKAGRVAATLALVAVAQCCVAQISTNGVGATTAIPRATGLAPGALSPSMAEQVEVETAQFWGIGVDEVRRARALMLGPRGAFSVANLSPLEILGIHARSDAERRRYAELFAKAMHADTERVLAFSVEYEQAYKRLYPQDQVVSFTPPVSPADRPAVPSAMADAADVPRSMIRPTDVGGSAAPRR